MRQNQNGRTSAAKVDLNIIGKRLDIFLEYATDTAICPVCGKLGNVHDQQPERVWRHLDTMQFEKAVHKLLPCADVVFDKHHVEAHLNEGVDNTRKAENKVLLARDDKRLVDSKYLWLKGFEHMSDEAIAHRNDLLNCALDTGKAWSLGALCYNVGMGEKTRIACGLGGWAELVRVGRRFRVARTGCTSGRKKADPE